MSDFEIVSNCVNALKEKDYNTALDLMTEDVRIDTGMMGVKNGKADVKSTFAMILGMGAKPGDAEQDGDKMFSSVSTPMGTVHVVFKVADGQINDIEMQKQ